MQLVQVLDERSEPRVGLVRNDVVHDLTAADEGIGSVRSLLERSESVSELLRTLGSLDTAPASWSYETLGSSSDVRLRAPIDAPEIWAAGVTYERSRAARVAESSAASFYAAVYESHRPELFLKTSHMLRTVGPNDAISIRRDSTWTVPEPELAVVLGHGGEIVGYTIGNDVTARDIEAANPLYLPQAKSFRGCCALGPTLLVADPSVDPSAWTIELRVERAGATEFEGEIPLDRMRRPLTYLRDYLVSDNEILPGTVLLTGTGIVPPDEFALRDGEAVEVSIGALGTLRNRVTQLPRGTGAEAGGGPTT
jgi:2-dehydro-3-deoxy-D-arabinonate dehydratase